MLYLTFKKKEGVIILDKDKSAEYVSYIAHESMLARMERTIKRLFILCLVIFICFVASNVAWLYYESQFQYVESTQTVTQDSGEGGNNNFVGGDSNGETDGQN